MKYSRIVGTGAYLPGRVVGNDEFAKRLDTSDAWIRERTGIAARHLADASQAASDLALEAVKNALAASGTRAMDIDMIVVATSTPDYVFPSTACLVQKKLGVRGCPAFDVQAVCSGFVYALATVDNAIRCGQGGDLGSFRRRRNSVSLTALALGRPGGQRAPARAPRQ